MDSLVVVSKVKGRIKEKAQMNTSAEVVMELTKHIEQVTDLAIQSALADKRKTVMGRDIQGALNSFIAKTSVQQ